jgi:uncharacterized membrane protein YdjX (TVP38/TMEM64 family)/rhodanese-related sulfurtransferase
LAAVLFLPGSVMTLAGGALFGPVLGTLYNLTGATLGATLAFLIARHLDSGWVVRKAGGRVRQLADGVEQEGWKFVAFVRLVPIFPFNLLNYALGLTRLKLGHYILGTFVFMFPGAVAYTYAGYAGWEAFAGGQDLVEKGLLALSLLAAAAFLPGLVTTLRRGPVIRPADVQRQLDAGEKILVLDVRSSADFLGKEGHVRDAVNVPIETLSKQGGQLEDYLDCPVAVIGESDGSAARAARVLSRRGFAGVRVVRGGMGAWISAGLPTVRDGTSEHKNGYR